MEHLTHEDESCCFRQLDIVIGGGIHLKGHEGSIDIVENLSHPPEATCVTDARVPLQWDDQELRRGAQRKPSVG